MAAPYPVMRHLLPASYSYIYSFSIHKTPLRDSFYCYPWLNREGVTCPQAAVELGWSRCLCSDLSPVSPPAAGGSLRGLPRKHGVRGPSPQLSEPPRPPCFWEGQMRNSTRTSVSNALASHFFPKLYKKNL